MHPQRHLLASLAIAAFSLFFNQQTPFFTVELFGYNLTVFLLCIIFGVFIDSDHTIDYRLNRWHMSESLESRFKKGRMFVVFHGIENIIILIGLSIVFSFLIFPTFSYFCHMAMDVYSNEVPPEAYSYIFRLRKIMTKTQNMPEHITRKTHHEKAVA